jgi:Flp pilus assembly protein TadD
VVVSGIKGQFMRAKSDYENSLEIDPEDAEDHFNRALACDKAGKSAEAIQAFRGFFRLAHGGQSYAIYIEYAKERILELQRQPQHEKSPD